MDRKTTEYICYGCREMLGDRDDHKCIDCQHNIYAKTFYFDNTKEVIPNPNYIGKEEQPRS